MSQTSTLWSTATAATSSAARSLTGWRRPDLQVVRRRVPTRRAPFVALVLGVLGAGLMGLLMLSTALQQGTFALDGLQSETSELRDRASLLSQEVAEQTAPANLAESARRAGMVQADRPAILDLDDPAATATGTDLADGEAADSQGAP